MTAREGAAAATPNPWLYTINPGAGAALQLLCFPYAGGGAMIYRDWARGLPAGCKVTAVQLPGRGPRIREVPVTALPQLIEELAPAVLPHLKAPFVFFGHSMGAVISFELARRLRREGARGPLKLFVSGAPAPQSFGTREPLHALPHEELVEELKRLNGTPREVLEHPELLELMLPLLRADFSICDTYEYEDGAPLDCPITVFGGLDDTSVTREGLEGWREQTSAAFTLRMLPGDHFFLHSAQAGLLAIVARQLANPGGGA